ncbi:MAG: hypothetical protein H6637_01105 [Ardenticatenales bacterium]|nr:hypothetical protein [Ardenticatenales bacterium]
MSWYSYLCLSKHLLKPNYFFPRLQINTFVLDSLGNQILLEPAYVVALDTEYSSHFLVACLNSKLLTFSYATETTTLSGGFYELQSNTLEDSPSAASTSPRRTTNGRGCSRKGQRSTMRCSAVAAMLGRCCAASWSSAWPRPPRKPTSSTICWPTSPSR